MFQQMVYCAERYMSCPFGPTVSLQIEELCSGTLSFKKARIWSLTALIKTSSMLIIDNPSGEPEPGRSRSTGMCELCVGDASSPGCKYSWLFLACAGFKGIAGTSQDVDK